MPNKKRGTIGRCGAALALAALLALAGCGGETQTVTVTVTEPPDTSAAAPQATTAGEEAADEAIKVEQTKLVYIEGASGGPFHTALVLLRNDSDETAIDVGGQLSILDANGGLVKSLDVTPVTILPGAKGLIVEDSVKLPAPLKDGSLKLQHHVDRFGEPASSPVSFSMLRYTRTADLGALPCQITGTVSNTFSERKENLQLRVAGFTGAKLSMGGFTYVNTVFPKADATFEVTFFLISQCPETVDRIEVLPHLAEDKIYNP